MLGYSRQSESVAAAVHVYLLSIVKLPIHLFTFKPNDYTTVGIQALLPPFVLIVLYLVAPINAFSYNERFINLRIIASGRQKISKTPSIFV